MGLLSWSNCRSKHNDYRIWLWTGVLWWPQRARMIFLRIGIIEIFWTIWVGQNFSFTVYNYVLHMDEMEVLIQSDHHWTVIILALASSRFSIKEIVDLWFSKSYLQTYQINHLVYIASHFAHHSQNGWEVTFWQARESQSRITFKHKNSFPFSHLN